MKAFKLFLIITGLLILGIGARMTLVNLEDDMNRYEESNDYYGKAMEYAQRDSQNIFNALKNSLPPPPEVKKMHSSLNEPFLSASQGVEVRLKGLEWNGVMVDSVIQPLKAKFGARYIVNYNQLDLDPDFPNSGYPDLRILIPDAPSLQIDDKNLVSKSFRRTINKEKPLETYNLNLGDGKKARMDLWLANFEVIFRIMPDDDHNRNREFPYNGRNQLSRKMANDIRGDREFKNQRYGNMTLFLEFRPKDTWYVGKTSQDGLFETNESPQIGIAAVEAIKIQKVGEAGINNRDKLIALSIENGMAFPLYDSYPELIDVFTGDHQSSDLNRQIAEVNAPYNELAQSPNPGLIYNPNLFGRNKYTAIQIKNLGSWKEKRGWLLGNTTYKADLFRAHFFIHLYVIGEWTVKPESFVATSLQPPVEITKRGALDFILPDFRLGPLGKFFSGFVLFVVLFVLFATFIKPLGRILELIIRRILKVSDS